jgi:hypothetical protein
MLETETKMALTAGIVVAAGTVQRTTLAGNFALQALQSRGASFAVVNVARQGHPHPLLSEGHLGGVIKEGNHP